MRKCYVGFSGSHSGSYAHLSLLGYNAVQTGESRHVASMLRVEEISQKKNAASRALVYCFMLAACFVSS
jgi:hypothetical protein